MKRKLFVLSLCILAALTGYAQNSSDVETKVKEIVSKYENVEGVNCMTVAKGTGLGLVKAMFKDEFGRDFMKGVTSITIIEYANAAQDVCLQLHKELDGLAQILEEIDVNREDGADDSIYARSFALTLDDNAMSDFVIAMENKESKMIMYMAGKIKAE